MVTARNYSDYYPYGVSTWVRNLEYAADVNIGQPYICNFGAPLAAAAAGMLNSGALTSGAASTFTASAGQVLNGGLVPHDSLTKRNGWGRTLSIVGNGATTRVLTVNGYDYLGQHLQEQITANGATPVNGLKAFQWIDNIVCGSSADTATITVGYLSTFGFPYTFQALSIESKDYAVAANAGTFVTGLAEGTAQTATNGDARGTYTPATVVPDGVHIFEVCYWPRRGNLHGNAAFGG
jgi:hypothetical protein